MTIQEAFSVAIRHHQAGQLPEAGNLYRQILAQHPDHPGALHYLGVMAYQSGQNDAAVDLIGRAIALNPSSPEAYSNLGNALKNLRRLDDAIAAFRRAIALNPGYPDAYSNLGNALSDKGQLDEAIAAYRQAIALKPDYLQAHSNLGNALTSKGQLKEGIAIHRKAVALAPNSPGAHSNLGTALSANGEVGEAIAAFRQAIALRPNYPLALCNLGTALSDTGELDQAVAVLRQAIAANPNFPEAHANLGSALKNQGQQDDAIAAFRQAVSLRPDYAAAHSSLIFTMQLHPAYDAGAIAEECRRWDRQHVEPLKHLTRAHGNDRNPDRRLRIGYVSPDLREHVVGRNVLPLFRRHDRSRFEITCYAQVARPDAMTDQFRQNADRWCNIVGLSDDQAAEQIRRDGIDILVDLALHTSDNRLPVFARKPAPVQVSFAGYPGSTGLTTIDYRLSDPYLEPVDSQTSSVDESIHSERTLRLLDSFWCYDPLDCRDVPEQVKGDQESRRRSGVTSFGCLNSLSKVTDTTLDLWRQVLRQVDRSRLVLLAQPGSQRQRTVDRLCREEIDPGRVEFVPLQVRRRYLEQYQRIDIGLDSFPYNGHTTSLDSFWMGVPVVTLMGKTAVSRAGWCQLSNLGLTELAAQTPEQFVRIAVELAGDLPRLTELRATLRPRMEHSPLMDAPRFARNIEAAYRHIWRTWCEEKGADLHVARATTPLN